MNIKSIKTEVTISVPVEIKLELKELQFLRSMAQHCIKTEMIGNLACERLDNILNMLGIKIHNGPVYGLFE